MGSWRLGSRNFLPSLATYLDSIGDRWTRGIDLTSTYDPYAAGLKRRVLPTLGHLPVAMITAGVVERAIDEWEMQYGRSTVKNSVAALVLVLDEAVRDGIIVRNSAKDRARRRTVGRSPVHDGPAGPRDLALPDVAALERLVAGVIESGAHASYGEWSRPFTGRYLHPDTQAVLDAGTAFSAWWSGNGPEKPWFGVVDGDRSGA